MNGLIYKTGKLALAAFSAALLNTYVSGETVSGYVYLDKDETGYRSSGDPGIANVAVSNQLDVVLTDEDGYYELPISEEGIVFISKPYNYDFVLDEQFLPKFYYIHRPSGSPDLEFEGIAPTGPVPDQLNFGLLAKSTAADSALHSILIGDPQPRNNRELDYFRDSILAEVAQETMDYIFVVGDIMYDDLSMFGRYNRMMQTLRTPVINIIGNHDLNLDAEDNRYARETFKAHYGPTYFSFAEKDTHFLILDNIDYQGRDKEGRPRYEGRIGQRQLEWIENDLKNVLPEQLLVILTHIPLTEPNRPNHLALNTSDTKSLMKLLEPYSNVLVLAAHVHTISHTFLGEEFGRNNPNKAHQILIAAASGSWWTGSKDNYLVPNSTQRDGTPKGYHKLHIENGIYSEAFKAAGFGSDYQLRIEKPKGKIGFAELNEVRIKVNLFNGSERSKVEARINRGDWMPMKHSPGSFSPFFANLQEQGHIPERIRALPTTHLWTMDMPNGLDQGTHLIEVRAEDPYGRSFSQSKIVEIID
ncbi:MAG: calcineurin-like phosphoesterase family protein [Opitutales bacterium]|nr:calcineurin-like phosphoesterase family protein [Opitutales bacterium]